VIALAARSTSGERLVQTSFHPRLVCAHQAGAENSTWSCLRSRQLRVPVVSADSACPTSASSGDLRKRGFDGFGPAWGSGPAYPLIYGAVDLAEPILVFTDPSPRRGTADPRMWGAGKVIWVVEPTYSGPLLVRGRKLDGTKRVFFQSGEPTFIGRTPEPELRLRGQGGHPSITRVSAPGCYGYQLDGPSFTKIIVFEARARSSGS
jgi:hypothetical protein